jgi:hypothetical protein
LGTFYNAVPGQNRKDAVEEWAKRSFPAQWAELEKVGQQTTNEGYRLFNIVREIKT